MKRHISNYSWKVVKDGWVLVIDMDEWLCITEKDLLREQENGTTILSTQGIEMFADSNSLTLDDIDLFSVRKGHFFESESKCICFYRPRIQEMNYTVGCHKCNPIGHIKFSQMKYVIQHMCFLGLPFIKNKMLSRYKRSETQIKEKQGSMHYLNNEYAIEQLYETKRNLSFTLDNLDKKYYFIKNAFYN
jgi:hypothetical protein